LLEDLANPRVGLVGYGGVVAHVELLRAQVLTEVHRASNHEVPAVISDRDDLCVDHRDADALGRHRLLGVPRGLLRERHDALPEDEA